VNRFRYLGLMAVALAVIGCGPAPKDPNTAPLAPIDRFSDRAGHLQVRSATSQLPGPNVPVDFDQPPFITQGLSPSGRPVRYYNFDVQASKAAPVYFLVRMCEGQPVPNQLPLFDVLPGDSGYSDFRRVVNVEVPRTYVPNTVSSVADLSPKWPREETPAIVNYPIVPNHSVASLRLGGGAATLNSGWYRGQVVKFFKFAERPLKSADGTVPTSPIFVTFNVNPDLPGGGPGSGFVVERGGEQTHNVVATLPTDPGYSPLWQVNVYDNAAFRGVKDLATAQKAKILAAGVALVNCPIVEVK